MDYTVNENTNIREVTLNWECVECSEPQERISHIGVGDKLNVKCSNCGFYLDTVDLNNGDWRTKIDDIITQQQELETSEVDSIINAVKRFNKYRLFLLSGAFIAGLSNVVVLIDSLEAKDPSLMLPIFLAVVFFLFAGVALFGWVPIISYTTGADTQLIIQVMKGRNDGVAL